MENKDRQNIVDFLGLVISLFLVGLFIYVVYNAIAFELNLPTFNYWVCLCGGGIFRFICGSIGKIFHKD